MVSSRSTGSQATMKEQRRSQRIRHDLVVELHDKNGARTVHAMDVARHGLFLATGQQAPRERHLVQLTVHLPDGPIKAAASVTRTLKNDGVDGVGVQFFALSDEAKQRWDEFIFDLQRSLSSPGRPAASVASLGPSFGPPSTREAAASQGATFLVKLKNVERLKDFAATHLASGGTVLFTPVLRLPGEVITLVVVHPKTDEEFRLPGIIHKAHEDRPKRLEIHFHGITPALLRSFDAYVETGHPPRVQLDPPVVPPSQRVNSEMELDLDVDVFDEDTLDTDDRIWRGDAADAGNIATQLAGPAATEGFTIPPFSVETDAVEKSAVVERPVERPAVAVTPKDPGLRPQTFLLRCDREQCASEPYAVDLGPCRGVLGLVADHAAFLSHKTGRIVTAPRLASVEEREQRVKAFVAAGGSLDSTLTIQAMLEAVSLAEPAKDPDTGAILKSTRAVERLEHAARRMKEDDPPARTKVACATCKEGHLKVERVST